jgi:intein/homing endonuclease
MRRVESTDILDLTSYEKIRSEFLERTIELKRPRRVHVGEILCFIFENRDTVIFQIQEMTRAERSVSEDAIAAEVAVYNELVPRDNELSATLMIEIPNQTSIRPQLDRLIGIDEHVHLDIGDETIRASFDDKQFQEDRVSAVQYVRFPLGSELAAKFRDLSISVELRVDHPNYAGKTAIEGETRASLAADLV